MDKILTLRYREETVSMSTTNTDKVKHFINWVSAYKHGIYDSSSSTINCNAKNDFIFCRKKAKELGLIPTVKNI